MQIGKTAVKKISCPKPFVSVKLASSVGRSNNINDTFQALVMIQKTSAYIIDNGGVELVMGIRLLAFGIKQQETNGGTIFKRYSLVKGFCKSS